MPRSGPEVSTTVPDDRAPADPGGGADGVVVRNLSVCVAATGAAVVERVSFSIPAGATLGLVGESGCGKSTLAVALLGLARRGLRISSGSVRIDGLDMLALGERQRRGRRGSLVSYVPQDPEASLNPVHRVGSQLREALAVHSEGNIDTRLQELLAEVGLADSQRLLRSYPHQLSGGQQQRIVIAMAFACRPRLIVLDEPATGLDVSTQRRLLETVQRLAQDHGCSALYVSHDLSTVAQLARATAVMYAGRIVELSASEPLFEHPRHPYTEALLAGVPSPDEPRRLSGTEGEPPGPGAWRAGCAFAPRCTRVTAECRAAVPALERLERSVVRCLHPLPVAPTRRRNERLVGPLASESPSGSGLIVRELCAGYGPVPVLHAVSLDVAPGGCTALVGESGSGKTTLARCVAGLHSRWQGEMLLGGQPLKPSPRARSTEQLRSIQYIFQNPFGSLNPTMTVAENIEEPLRHFERLSATARRARALEALELAHLGVEFADSSPVRLSGGERQRAAVARALVVHPDVLICDEITSALDVSAQALLIERLRELQLERGLAMLFITHNIALVRSLAQRVVVIREGSVVESGPAEQVLGHPRHPYTQQLLRDVPRLAVAAPGGP